MTLAPSNTSFSPVEPTALFAEFSALGFRTGDRFPETIPAPNLGNGEPFILSKVEGSGIEVVYVQWCSRLTARIANR